MKWVRGGSHCRGRHRIDSNSYLCNTANLQCLCNSAAAELYGNCVGLACREPGEQPYAVSIRWDICCEFPYTSPADVQPAPPMSTWLSRARPLLKLHRQVRLALQTDIPGQMHRIHRPLPRWVVPLPAHPVVPGLRAHIPQLHVDRGYSWDG